MTVVNVRDVFSRHGVDTALLEWISKYAVGLRAYTTPDSAVSYS